MKKRIVAILGLLVLVSTTNLCWSGEKVNAGPSDYLLITGMVSNPQGKGIKEVKVTIFVNGRETHLPDELVTSSGGNFQSKLALPQGALPGAKVELEFSKPSYKTSGRVAPERLLQDQKDDKGNIDLSVSHRFCYAARYYACLLDRNRCSSGRLRSHCA